MAQEQNYEVNYTINVEASDGVKQLQAFTQSVEALSKFRNGFGDAIKNINTTMRGLDKIFPLKDGERKRSYTFSLQTRDSEARLKRIEALLDSIRTKAAGINVSINAGTALKSRSVKRNAEQLLGEKGKAVEAVQDVQNTQRTVTKAIGKINSALIHFQTPRELNIKTDAAEKRLQSILSLLQQIRGQSKNIAFGGAFRTKVGIPLSNTHERVFRLPPNVHFIPYGPGLVKQTPPVTTATPPKQIIPQVAVAAIRNRLQGVRGQDRMIGHRQRSAINRLQYSRAPSIRNMMPFAYMLNGYMLYSMMRSEVTKAVEYANIMETAHSILKVADTDLVTFDKRFDAMAQRVRQVGIQTKFTAVEVAGAVKYLAMAGQSIDAINKSIRPIANLALIGDNDISQIADLVTNIMAGYNVSPDSMNTIADIIASTVSRSNVNIIETAESFKMAAGFLQTAGVEFSEAAAAIGLLGNAGIKGTMAGTTLRAMATRFAAPPREAQKVIDRLGVQLYRHEVMYGHRVEMLRPLADIFEDLNKKGATTGDMHKLFGRIGGSGATMLLNNYERLRELAIENRASHGISGELAHVKQETTKGLWYQMTSQLSETFMEGYELLEPKIRGVLKDFLSKFKAPEFTRGLVSLGNALMDVFSILGNIATWFGRNFSWIEPLIFTGLVASKIFKLSGAVTNLGVALGFLGKQSVAASGLQLLTSLTGLGGKGVVKAFSFAQKRALVTELSALGVAGKGAMVKALANAGLVGGAAGMVTKSTVAQVFATQAATGNGFIGAAASIGSLGAAAVATTAGIAALIGAVGWLGYKMWQLNDAKNAIQEDISSNEKYRYKSLEDLYDQMEKTRKKAEDTKTAVDSVVGKTLLKEKTSQPTGIFSKRWYGALINQLLSKELGIFGIKLPEYTFERAQKDDLTESIKTFAEGNVQPNLDAVYAKLGRMKDPLEVEAFIGNIEKNYGIPIADKDSTLMAPQKGFFRKYIMPKQEMTLDEAMLTKPYAEAYNANILDEIDSGARAYWAAISSSEGAAAILKRSGFDVDILSEKGFKRGKDGFWSQVALPSSATKEEQKNAYSDYSDIHEGLVKTAQNLRVAMGGSAQIVANIMEKAGISPALYSNDPKSDDPEPYNRPGISVGGLDDGGAGGNYSGTGKLSSASPKQIFVNISNLLSVETIDLMKSPEGQTAEIQDLKDKLAQALIDTVHDFDASWNA